MSKRVRRPSNKAKETVGERTSGSEDDVEEFAVQSFREVDDSSDESVHIASSEGDDEDDDDDDIDEDDEDEEDGDDEVEDEDEDEEIIEIDSPRKRRRGRTSAKWSAANRAAMKRVPPRNYGDTPLTVGDGDGDAALWRAQLCVHCHAEMQQLCFNRACAACCHSPPSGRQCVAHGRFALMSRSSDTRFDVDPAHTGGGGGGGNGNGGGGGGDPSSASTLSFFSAELQLFVCPCGSEWPTQKSFAGHCGQCEAWKARHTTPAGSARRRHQQATPFVGEAGAADLARLFPRSDSADAAWTQLRNDFEQFPPLSALVARHSARSLALALNANQLRLYIERCGVRAGPTLGERQRQLEVLADAPQLVGLAVSAMAQPRWVCLCGRQYAFEMALARHAVHCSEWEPLPSVCGVALADVELRTIAAVCGARQVTRDHKPSEALREAAAAALMLQRGMQAAAIEARIACLQMTYGVPVRSALTHIATMLASESLAPTVKRVLNDAKAALMPLFETISSPVSRCKSTLDELEECDTKLRKWLAVLCHDPVISGMMAEASRNHTLH